MADRYPDIPGAKGPDGTSQDAAEAIAPTVSHLRRVAMHSLARLGEATPLEAVAISGVTRESLQPRFSELRAMGLIEPTGARRRNPSGKGAAVLRLTEKGEGRTLIVNIEAIARHYGGKVCKGNALIPTPGHSHRDRGTAIKASALAPDGCLVACYNGTQADALAVKEMLRADGFLSADSRRELSAAERRSIRQAELARKRERLAAEQAAAQCAADLWANASRADSAHPYLVAKALEPFGIRQAGRDLLVPMVDPGFRLWNVQRIRPDGFKLFCKDGRTAGLFWPHGVHLSDGRPSAGPLVIGEGFATMASVHSATGYGVAAAMSARNLETVARAMRKLFPTRELVIAADDDRHLAENIGLGVARKAAQAVGGVVAIPRPETCSADSSADFADIPRGDVAWRIEAARLGG